MPCTLVATRDPACTALLLFTVALAIGNTQLFQRLGASPLPWADLTTTTATGIGLALLFELALVVFSRALLATVAIRAKVG